MDWDLKWPHEDTKTTLKHSFVEILKININNRISLSQMMFKHVVTLSWAIIFNLYILSMKKKDIENEKEGGENGRKTSWWTKK